VACVDGLKGLPAAMEAVLPKPQVPVCIVHKVRNSLRYVPWKERRAVATDLRTRSTNSLLSKAPSPLKNAR
jgi:putative transposase